MDRKSFAITAGIGFVTLVMLFLVAIPAAFLLSSSRVKRLPKDTQQFDNQPSQGAESLAPSDPDVQLPQTGEDTSPSVIPAQPNRASTTLVDLYQSLHPGVVNIRLSSQHSPEPSLNGGSGFIYDDLGYIVASNHVVAGAAEAVVMFFNRDEVIAKVVGADR